MTDSLSVLNGFKHAEQTYLWAHWVLPVSSPPIERGFIALDKGRLSAVGAVSELPEALQHQARRFFESEALNPILLTPGLVNTHAHLELSFEAMIPREPGEDMTDWLFRVVACQKQESTCSAQQIRCEQGVAELLRTGTTCVNDISSQGASFKALERAGLRGVVSMEFFHPDWEVLNLGQWTHRYESMFSPYATHDRIHPGLSPHSPYNVSPNAWQTMVEACQPKLVHSHCAESKAEIAWLSGQPSSLNRLHETMLGRRFSSQPQRPAGDTVPPLWMIGTYLKANGLLELDSPLVLTHCVYTQTSDRKLFEQAGVGVSHCPRSNLHLQGETLHWADWDSLAISIALGTDSRLSAPSLDMRDEARQAVACHGWSAKQALEAITLAGAKVMGLESQIGSLARGKQADVVSWRANGPSKSNAPESLWLEGSTTMEQLWVQGRPLNTSVRV